MKIKQFQKKVAKELEKAVEEYTQHGDVDVDTLSSFPTKSEGRWLLYVSINVEEAGTPYFDGQSFNEDVEAAL